MTLQGTVINGAIVQNGTLALPEGAIVWVEVETDEELGDFTPPPTETYEEHLAKLRQSIENWHGSISGCEG